MRENKIDTYLFLLFIEVVNDNTYKQVESEERTKNDEKYKIQVHIDVCFSDWLPI